jgi:proteasome lid subunit RPN8/RPN11
MSAVAPDWLAEGQEEALEAVRSIAEASGGALTMDLDYQELGGYYLVVRVYLSSASLLSSKQGIKLEDWEPIDILIPKDFPYTPPIAWAGRDNFPEVPHQAQGSAFCVRVEDSNWDRTAGMPGFLRAVIDTYQRIALGTLQGHLQPWQFINSYQGEGCAVIRADLPLTGRTGPGNWRQWAIGIQVNESRIDIIEWLGVTDAETAADLTGVLSGELARIKAETPGAFLVPAVTMAKPVAVEYCHFWLKLLVSLQKHGVELVPLLGHLAQAAAINQPSSGEGERAVALFRVAADTEPTAAGQDARFAVAQLTQGDVGLLTGLLADTQDAQDDASSLDEFFEAGVPWTRVYDGRGESVLRRATGRPTEKLAGTKILLLGCGGLGAPMAEHFIRSGAARLHIVDSGTVSPGVLSRQPYEDADIGKPKAEVLASRLGRIRPQTEITASVADIISSDLFSGPDLSQYDLVIDATANRSVAAKIERAQRDQHDRWPTLITVAISQQATHGVATVTPRGTAGAGVDLLRRLGLKACMSTALSDVYTAFFPPEDSRLNFRPDASCSGTTFIGSSTDMSALAAQLLHGALTRLNLRPGAIGHGSLSIVRLGNDDEPKAALVVLDLPPDRKVIDQTQTYEVRIDETAMETIREHVRASVNGRTCGAGLTAGLLLGQFDSACRVAWVSQATGLPPESSASPLNINQDVDDVRDFLEDRRSRSGGMLTLIGFWHTHLGGSAEPSQTDVANMRQTAASPEWRSAPALLLELTVADDRSVGESGSPWLPQVHAETFATGPDLAHTGQ